MVDLGYSGTMETTYVEQIKALESRLAPISQACVEARAALIAKRMREFTTNGGCSKCRGRGWIVTWDTLDHMDGGDASYGPCTEPGCTEETRAASGLEPSHNKYDNWNRIWHNPIEDDSEYKLILGPLEAEAARIRSEIEGLKSLCGGIGTGTWVKVARGRSGKGSVGCIFWTRAGEWGTKCGLTAANGDTVWTYTHNCDKLAI